jgi:predicted nucleotide-binding protein
MRTAPAPRRPELIDEATGMPDARDVFVIHGRDEQARKALWSFLQAIDLHPAGRAYRGSGSRYTI